MKNLKPSIPKPKLKMPKMPRVSAFRMPKIAGMRNPLRFGK